MSAVRTLVNLIKSCGIGLFISSLVTYLFGKAWRFIYVMKTGVSSPTELSEDYGGAFFQLVAMILVFAICFVLSFILVWHRSGADQKKAASDQA